MWPAFLLLLLFSCYRACSPELSSPAGSAILRQARPAGDSNSRAVYKQHPCPIQKMALHSCAYLAAGTPIEVLCKVFRRGCYRTRGWKQEFCQRVRGSTSFELLELAVPPLCKGSRQRPHGRCPRVPLPVEANRETAPVAGTARPRRGPVHPHRLDAGTLGRRSRRSLSPCIHCVTWAKRHAN